MNITALLAIVEAINIEMFYRYGRALPAVSQQQRGLLQYCEKLALLVSLKGEPGYHT